MKAQRLVKCSSSHLKLVKEHGLILKSSWCLVLHFKLLHNFRIEIRNHVWRGKERRKNRERKGRAKRQRLKKKKRRTRHREWVHKYMRVRERNKDAPRNSALGDPGRRRMRSLNPSVQMGDPLGKATSKCHDATRWNLLALVQAGTQQGLYCALWKDGSCAGWGRYLLCWAFPITF
jgi:hypothetical protein